MSTTGLHICSTETRPEDAALEIGARRVCDCGRNFVWREGHTRGSVQTAWWPAPAVPRQRRVRDLLFGPRKG
ncbi:MAG: hypothetical protein AVDCRST_MAG32-3202 [uncultured Nocardioides sp.]|uniref:Uncharacterized protein n=1 Tax=uncultured Nocardioides sp. TaxID=198441 RepID=A0A6J4P316_9ACTN|nr:MAG: hypothetical protein AVDCRST_MAG32-3202 [uncultured Nocardioides sp.]